MKFKIASSALLDALKIASSATNAKSIPALACVLIDAYPGYVRLSGSDAVARIDREIEADVEQGGAALCHCGRLMAICREADGEIEISASETELSITGGRIKARLPLRAVEEFPVAAEPDQSAAGLTIPADTLLALIRSVAPAMGTDPGRPAIMSVHVIMRDRRVLIEATDGNVLAILDSGIATKQKLDFILPDSELPRLYAILPAIDGNVSAAVGQNRISFGGKGIQYTFAAMHAVYPNTAPIVPAPVETVIELNRADTVKAINQACLVAGIDAHSRANVFLTASETQTVIYGEDRDKGSLKSELNEPQKVKAHMKFVAKSLASALRVFSTDRVRIEYIADHLPIVIRDEKATTVVMPLRTA